MFEHVLALAFFHMRLSMPVLFDAMVVFAMACYRSLIGTFAAAVVVLDDESDDDI
jgi:hypothetical protein